MGGQPTSCSATALVLHFAYTLLTLRCWSYTSLLVPRGPDRTTIGPASRTWYLAGPCPFTHGASPAMRVACWLCSARTDGADTHDPSRLIPPCNRAYAQANPPLPPWCAFNRARPASPCCTRSPSPSHAAPASSRAATGTVRPRRRGEERRGAPVPRRPERGYVLRELYIERAE